MKADIPNLTQGQLMMDNELLNEIKAYNADQKHKRVKHRAKKYFFAEETPKPKRRKKGEKAKPRVYENIPDRLNREKINATRRSLGLAPFPAGGEPKRPKRDEILYRL